MTENDFDKFLLWERTTHDVIDFKKIYVDMCGDVLAGLMLSEIVYWYLPSKGGDPKMKVVREGVRWIACARAEWWDRTRMSKRQADRAMKLLEEVGLITRKAFMFNHQRMMHLRIDRDMFLKKWHELVECPLENPYNSANSLPSNETVTPYNETVTLSNGSVTSKSPIRDFQVTKSDTPITESTTESTSKHTQKTTNALVTQIQNHPVWQAYCAAYPDAKPRIDPRTAFATLNTLSILQEHVAANDYSLLDITDLVRWKLSAGRKVRYFVSYVDDDMPDFKAYQLAFIGNTHPRASPAQPIKPKSETPEKPTFDAQTWVRKEIEKGTFDPAKPPVLKVSNAYVNH